MTRENRSAESVAKSSGGLVSSPFYVLRGLSFLRDHRALWKYAAAPVVISVVVLGASYYLLYHYFLGLLNTLVGQQGYWVVLYYALLALGAILLLVVFFFLFIILATVIAAPFNDLISQKTEELVTGRFVDEPFSPVQLMKDIGRGLGHTLRILGLYVGLLLVCLLLNLIPVVGPPLFTGAMMLLSAYMLSFEYLSYCMDRRRFSYQSKRKFMRSALRTVLGFGLGMVAMAAIPLVNLLLLPCGAVGGTLLFLELERSKGAATDDRK